MARDWPGMGRRVSRRSSPRTPARRWPPARRTCSPWSRPCGLRPASPGRGGSWSGTARRVPGCPSAGRAGRRAARAGGEVVVAVVGLIQPVAGKLPLLVSSSATSCCSVSRPCRTRCWVAFGSRFRSPRRAASRARSFPTARSPMPAMAYKVRVGEVLSEVDGTHHAVLLRFSCCARRASPTWPADACPSP
jgi:hypothetical protein